MPHDDYTELRGDIAEIKTDLKELRSKVEVVLINVPLSAKQLTELERVAKDHEDRLRTLETFAPFIKAMMAVASLLGVSVIALIWALIVGQAQVVFP